MKIRCAQLIACLLGVLLSAVPVSPDAQAQQSKRRQKTQPPSGTYLPRASFGGYASGGLSGTGMSLSGGGGGGMMPQMTGGMGPGMSPGQMSGMQGGGTNELPVVHGLHLQEGLDRREGSGFQPYDPGEPSLKMARVRWDPRRFPLKIWISEGKSLPPVPWNVIANDRVPRVMSMLNADPNSLAQLPSAPGWKPEMNEAAAEGFEQWRDLEKEGVISYGFVDDPNKADVMVFFTDNFMGADGPGGTSVHGQTYGQLFTGQQVMQKMQLGQRTVPVIIELKTSENTSRLQADAAHEFGHALGIKAHSPYRQDLMYVNRMVDSPSPADKATLRALYKEQPQYWYY